VKIGWSKSLERTNLAESFEVGYGSKRAVLPAMMVIPSAVNCNYKYTDGFQISQKDMLYSVSLFAVEYFSVQKYSS
jgi:hypothetical protein